MNERPIPVAKPPPALHVEPTEDGFRLLAGDRPWRTPAGNNLVVPTRALAEVLAMEIAAARSVHKNGRARMDDLGHTRLAVTAIDRIGPAVTATREALLAFASTDLLCYRDAGGSPLRVRQDTEWQPLLEWLAQTFAVRLIVVDGVMPQPQPQSALDVLVAALDRYDPFVLAGFGLAVETASSLVVGLALANGKIDALQASALADLEEIYQNEQWGEDDEAVAKRRLRAADMALAERFLTLLRTPNTGNKS
jgi:chaperone required for assembly of F1-ATPase